MNEEVKEDVKRVAHNIDVIRRVRYEECEG